MGNPENAPADSTSTEWVKVVAEEKQFFSNVAERRELLPAIMTMGESRRAQADQLMWQIPALSLTAQAFLTTVIFNDSTSNPGRLVASFTAFVFVIAALQSLLKHRYDEGVWARWLKAFEEHCELPNMNTGDRRQAVALSGGDGDDPPDTPKWLYRLPFYILHRKPFNNSAFRVWAMALATIVFIDFGLVIVSGLSLFGCWDPLGNG